MKIIKIVDFLADKLFCKCNGDVWVLQSFSDNGTLIDMMKERLSKLEMEEKVEKDFKKLSKEQEREFIKNLISRLELEK